MPNYLELRPESSVSDKIRYFEENPFIFPGATEVEINPSPSEGKSGKNTPQFYTSGRTLGTTTFVTSKPAIASSNLVESSCLRSKSKSKVDKTKSDENRDSSGFFSSLFDSSSKAVPLSESLNMDRTKRTILSVSSDALEEYKRTVLDLCQGCRSIAVSQDSYDDAIRVRRYRNSVNACLDLSQSLACDLVDLSLSSLKPVVTRFSLTHICPVKSTRETVPLIDNEFISSPCCFTALYKLTDWKKKLIPALDLESSSRKLTAGEETETVQKCPINASLLKIPRSSKYTKKQLFESNLKNEPCKTENVYFNHISSKKSKSRKNFNSDIQYQYSAEGSGDQWPWEINESLRLKILKEQQKLKQQVLNDIDEHFEGITSYSFTPSPGRRKMQISNPEFSQSDSKIARGKGRKGASSKRGNCLSKISEDRNSERVLNYSLQDSGMPIEGEARNNKGVENEKNIFDDKWPWEDEKSVSEYLNETMNRTMRHEETFDGNVSDWNISPIAKKEHTPQNDSYEEISEDIPSRPVSSRATVYSMPCRAPDRIPKSLQKANKQNLTPERNPGGAPTTKAKKVQRCLNVRMKSESSSDPSPRERVTSCPSSGDAERPSEDKMPVSYSRKTSQHCAELVSRQPSANFHDLIEDILMNGSENDMRSNIPVQIAQPQPGTVYHVEAEVHQEPTSLFHDLLLMQRLNPSLTSAEELREEFYDLPNFHKKPAVSFESLSTNSKFSKEVMFKYPGSEPFGTETDKRSMDMSDGVTSSSANCLKGDQILEQSFVSVSSINDTDCFRSSLLKNGLKKAARSIFKKSDISPNDSSASGKSAPMSRYMSFVSDVGGYHSDSEFLINQGKQRLGPFAVTPSSSESKQMMSPSDATPSKTSTSKCPIANQSNCSGLKNVQSDLENSSSGVLCDCSTDYVSQDLCHQECCSKETQTEFSGHNSSKNFTDQELTSILDNTVSSAATSGCYDLTLALADQSNKSEKRSLIDGRNSTTLGELALNENTVPFSDISQGLEKCFSYAEEYFNRKDKKWFETEDIELRRNEETIFPSKINHRKLSTEVPILPDISTRINNVESAFIQAASAFSSLDDVLESCQQTISQMPAGSVSSEISLSMNNSRLSTVRNEDLESNPSLKRTNFRLSPLTSPMRKKDKVKESSEESLRVERCQPLQTSSKACSPLESKHIRDIDSERSISYVKDSVIRELQMRGSLESPVYSEVEKESISDESDMSLLAPLAASESIITVSSARVSTNFDRDSFMEENRRSSSAKMPGTPEIGHSAATGCEAKVENYDDSCHVSILNRNISGSNNDMSSISEFEKTSDYDEQYKEISDSYQKLDQNLSSIVNIRRSSLEASSIFNTAMVCDEDSLNEYRIDPIADSELLCADLNVSADSIVRNQKSFYEEAFSKLDSSQKITVSEPLTTRSKSNHPIRESELNDARYFTDIDNECSGFESSLTFGSVTNSNERENNLVDFDYTVGLKCEDESICDAHNSFRVSSKRSPGLAVVKNDSYKDKVENLEAADSSFESSRAGSIELKPKSKLRDSKEYFDNKLQNANQKLPIVKSEELTVDGNQIRANEERSPEPAETVNDLSEPKETDLDDSSEKARGNCTLQ